MTATLIDSHAEGFADGNAGHSYNFGGAGAPSVGDWDVLCVNSITTVSTPSGFAEMEPAVGNQAAYMFGRKAVGGEGSTVTITTSGNFNTIVNWARFSGAEDFVDASSAQANNSNGTALPALSTGTLPETGMLVVAFAALNNHDGDLAASPEWTGWTPLESASLGSAGSSASLVSFTAYETNAGTAAETVNSVTWLNNTRNRYALAAWFTATASGGTVTGVATANLGGITAAAAGVRRTAGTATANLGALTATALGDRTVYGTAAASLGALTAAAAGTPTVKGAAAAALGALTATASGARTVHGIATANLGGLTATATDGVELTGAGPRVTSATAPGRRYTTSKTRRWR